MRETEFRQKLKESPLPIVVDFWAPWCTPCRAISPVLEKLAEEYADRVALWKINTDEESTLAAQLRIFSIPTVVVYRNGEELVRRTGVKPEPVLRELFEIGMGQGTSSPSGALTQTDRILRLAAGLILASVGLWGAHSWMLVFVGALIAFSGVYDRCPLWQALSSLWKKNA